MIRARRLVALSLATVLLWLCLVAIASAATPAAGDRTAALRGSFGTYAGSPRGADGRVDVERLVAQLVDLRANTYHWLIWTALTDWDDLRRFLPRAREHGILVWACLVPPTRGTSRTTRNRAWVANAGSAAGEFDGHAARFGWRHQYARTVGSVFDPTAHEIRRRRSK